MRLERFVAERFASWVAWYNTQRPHSMLDGLTPLQAWLADDTVLHCVDAGMLRHLLLAGTDPTTTGGSRCTSTETKRLSGARRRASRRTRTELAPLSDGQTTEQPSRLVPGAAGVAGGHRPHRATSRSGGMSFSRYLAAAPGQPARTMLLYSM
jgi:hypothetical protein